MFIFMFIDEKKKNARSGRLQSVQERCTLERILISVQFTIFIDNNFFLIFHFMNKGSHSRQIAYNYIPHYFVECMCLNRM